MKIGEIIRSKYEQSGMRLTAFAEKINTGRNNVYHIFNRDSVDTDMLMRISQVLQHDFFQYYRTQPGNEVTMLQEPEVKYLKKENEIKMHYIENLERKLHECEAELKKVKQMLDSK